MKVSGPNLISNFVGRVDYGSSKATCGGCTIDAGLLVQEEGDGAILVGRQRRQRPSAASRFSFLHGLAEASARKKNGREEVESGRGKNVISPFSQNE